MVVFQADEIHFCNSMKAMNGLRHDKSFCDVRLIVGMDSVHAHKCVLAAGSSYFRSLFLGKFTEATLEDINLSEVTDSVEALELILDFIYTGEIDIDCYNLGIIVKLSSFFLVETLREFCISFMKNSLCLKTCLEYYLYSLDYGLPDIESKTAQMVQARFHDCLIFQDKTLKILPEDLVHLVNTNMLDHCSSFNLLKFIAEWVGQGLTERHVSMGTELLDIINSKGNSLLVNYTETTEHALQNCMDRLQNTLEKISLNGQDKFLRRFRQILSKAFYHKHLETKNYNLRVPQSPRSKLANDTKVKAVLCMTPRPHVIEAFEKKKNSGVNMEQQQQPEIRREPIMDLFAYVPNTESWHHIQEFTQDIEPISCVLDEMLWGLWQMAIFQDELIFLNCILEEMNLYSLKTKTWRWLPFDVQIEGLLEANEFCNDFCVTCGSDGTMYLIGKIKLVSNDDEPLDLNFKGFKFDPSDMTWRQIFQTDNFDFPVSELRFPQIHAKVSSASNELLFTYARQEEVGTCWNMAYVVNLDDENLATSCTQLLAAYQTSGDMLFCGINIMEGKNCFFIISNGTDGGKVQVKYEYKFRSHRLVELNSTEKHVSVIEPHFHRARYFDNDVFPCWSEQSVTDMDTLWYFEGNLDKVSAFTEVTLNRSKNPVIKRHPPPPFTCVAALWAGSVSADLFINKHPVSSFPFVE